MAVGTSEARPVIVHGQTLNLNRPPDTRHKQTVDSVLNIPAWTLARSNLAVLKAISTSVVMLLLLFFFTGEIYGLRLGHDIGYGGGVGERQ